MTANRMTPNGTHHADDDTPLPWESEEQSVRAAIQKLGSHVIQRLDSQDQCMQHVSKQVAALHEDYGRMLAAFSRITGRLDEICDRSSDTGRHIIELAEGVGAAKALAGRERRDSFNPVAMGLRAIGWAGKALAEHWVTHVGVAVAGAATAWLLHHWRLLP